MTLTVTGGEDEDQVARYSEERKEAVFNHLSFCMLATTLTWIYAEHLNQAPIRRYASQHTTKYTFADVRRSLAKQIANEGFGIGYQDLGKPLRNPLISAIMRLVA